MSTTTDPVIPRAAIVATTEASHAHRDASGPYGAVKCQCGQTFRTGVEQLQHASHAILTAAIPHLRPLVEGVTQWAPGTDEHLAEAKRQMEVAVKMAPILDERLKEARELGRQEMREEIAKAFEERWINTGHLVAAVTAARIARDTGKGNSA